MEHYQTIEQLEQNNLKLLDYIINNFKNTNIPTSLGVKWCQDNNVELGSVASVVISYILELELINEKNISYLLELKNKK